MRRVSQNVPAWRNWAAYLVLFLIAFIPRVMRLGAYITVDEQRWIERSVDFVYNFTHGDLATMASGHPGVTAMWGFGAFLLGWFALTGEVSTLYQMRADNYYDLPHLLSIAGMFTILVTSLTVVASYWLLKKLLGTRTAFLAALLIALNPYYLAHSRRVHLDAILTSAMFLSALALLVYIIEPGSVSPRRYLFLSGLLAGLAWLTKLPALFLVPFAVLAMAAGCVDWTKGLRLNPSMCWRRAADLLLWLAVACLVFWVFWPSMWVNPGHTLGELARGILWSIETPHGPGVAPDEPMQFFMGRVVSDPGLAYYPLTVLYRLSPLVFLFFPISLVALAVGRGRNRLQLAGVLTAVLGLAYILFFGVMMSLAGKKLESYILPVHPMIDVLAAVGLVASMRWLAGKWQGWRDTWSASRILSALTVLALVAILSISFLWLRLMPYYSAYFNPVLGGAEQAARLFAFGGGEGLDMAAEYLNQKEGAADLTVSAAYPNHVFRYHFDGTTWPLRYGNWTGTWLLADYVVSYISYAQRGIPSAEVLEFFQTLQPEYVARINGVDYASVYRVPSLVSEDMPLISHPISVDLEDQVTFLGYDLGQPQVEAGEQISVTLYWRRQQPLQVDYSVYLRLVNGVYHVWGKQDGAPLYGAMPTSLWEEGMNVADPRQFQVLPGTPPGVYQIAVGMYDPSTMGDLNPSTGEQELLLGPVTIVRGASSPPPSPQNPREANLEDQVLLLGFDLEGQPMPGHGLHLTLFWEALSPMEADYTVFVHLVGPDGKIWGQRDSQPVTGFYPTTLWTAGEFVRDQYDLDIPEDTPPGEYTLIVGMYRAGTGQRLSVLDEKGNATGDHVRLDTIQVLPP